MSRAGKILLVWVAALSLVFAYAVALTLLHGCAGADPRAVEYGAMRTECVHVNATAEAARRCMCAVDKKYDRPMQPYCVEVP